MGIKQKGNFKKTDRFLKRASKLNYRSILKRYGEAGVAALSTATPIDSGLTAQSWDYVIVKTLKGYTIYWTNSNVQDGAMIAILLQYGHATRSGTFIEGTDYINPVLKPIFDQIADDIWREVTAI